MSTALTAAPVSIPLRDGTVFVLPVGRFPAPSQAVIDLLGDGRGRRAALAYAREAFVADADGVRLSLSVFAAADVLAGDRTVGPEITDRTANVDGYLRARAVFANPQLFANVRGTGRCDCCNVEGPGWILIAPDAMCSPSEVGFLGDCCDRKK